MASDKGDVIDAVLRRSTIGVFAGCSGRAQIAAADGASDVAIVVLALAPKQH